MEGYKKWLRSAEWQKVSKEKNPEARQAVAEAIRTKRQEYFKRIGEIHDRLTLLREKAEGAKLSGESAAAELATLREELALATESLLSRWWNRKNITATEIQVTEKQEEITVLETLYIELQQDIRELEQQEKNTHEFDECRDMLERFYKEQDEAFNRYVEDERARDVKSVMEKYGRYIVHGINPSYVPNENSLLNPNTDWKTKLKIALLFGPALSTSAVNGTEPGFKSWSRMGLLVRSGHVDSASAEDAATIARGFTRRSPVTSWGSTETSAASQEIATALEGSRQWNEFVVSRPEYAGMYYYDDVEAGLHDASAGRVPVAELAATCKEFGLPLFAFRQGVLYEVPLERSVALPTETEDKKQISIKDISQSNFVLDAELRQQFRADIMFDCPFRLQCEDLSQIEARSKGRTLYLRLYQAMHRANESSIDRTPYVEADLVPTLSTFADAGTKYTVYMHPGSKKYFLHYAERHRKSDALSAPETWSGWQSLEFSPSSFVELGSRNYELGEEVRTTEGYLNLMAHAIEKEVARVSQEDAPKQTLNELAMHLYGFAEQARDLGDSATAERGVALATTVMSEAEKNTLIESRIDEDGRVKITEKDLQTFA